MSGDLEVTILTSLNILLQFKNLLERVDLMYQLPKCPYSHFFETGVSFEGLFPCEYPQKA